MPKKEVRDSGGANLIQEKGKRKKRAPVLLKNGDLKSSRLVLREYLVLHTERAVGPGRWKSTRLELGDVLCQKKKYATLGGKYILHTLFFGYKPWIGNL